MVELRDRIPDFGQTVRIVPFLPHQNTPLN
jgi:hypothetical protein